MALPQSAVSSQFHLGPKGRSVLPVAVRRAAGIADGAIVVAHAEGPGRIVIETPEAVRARVWAAAPPVVGRDMAADVRKLREQDAAISDAASANRAVTLADACDDSDAAGAALLARLGL